MTIPLFISSITVAIYVGFVAYSLFIHLQARRVLGSSELPWYAIVIGTLLGPMFFIMIGTATLSTHRTQLASDDTISIDDLAPDDS